MNVLCRERTIDLQIRLHMTDIKFFHNFSAQFQSRILSSLIQLQNTIHGQILSCGTIGVW